VYNGNDWHNLNDGDRTTTTEGTMGHTTNDARGVMQLDFGKDGVKTNRILVAHRSIEIRRSNGVTLEAIDPNESVLFRYVCSGINIGSPAIDTFDIFGQKL
jgi:hypothetical protein